MQFDFAGDALWVVDKSTGEAQKATTLVCLLPYSGMSFAIAMLSTRMEYFFTALSKALTYFGGVPEVSKTDNMAQWVKRSGKDHEPDLNDTARQWGLYYGTDFDVCRVRKPRDKGPVEGLVNKVYKFHYGRMSEETFTSIEALNNRLMELNDMFNDRVTSGSQRSRRQIFESEEKPFLKPLPAQPFTFKYEKKVVINNRYHVQVDKYHFYSVPYQYVGHEAKVSYDSETVEVWVDFQRIAVHKRSFSHGYSTMAEHMPENHREYTRSKSYNAAYYLKAASGIGPATRQTMQSLLDRVPFVSQAYRSCSGVLRLAGKYGNNRVEAACKRIGPVYATYKKLESMLEAGLDRAVETPLKDIFSVYMPENDNVRGAETYK